jgi:NAD-dependent DNA ligase
LPPYCGSKFATCSSTDYLIVGEDPGSKLQKAEAIGVKKISYNGLLRIIEERSS